MSVHGYEKVLGEIEADEVPGPVPYAVIAPDGFSKRSDLPLVLSLHGGGGSRDALLMQAEIWQSLWERGAIPPAVVAMASVTPRGFYMNFADGSERWEDFMLTTFLTHLRKTYPVSSAAGRTLITGVSMGGMGALRLALKYPDHFAAVAALEPGIEPILRFEDMLPKHRFWRGDAVMTAAFGDPVDTDYWAANNPATIVVDNAERIRASDLQIYVEAGDEDQFWLYEGAEFLHRVLWDQQIRHEYHLVRGADHVGPSMAERLDEAIRFLFRYDDPWPVTPRMQAVDRMLDPLKARIEGKDHYNQD
jgi:S-formylglutathione hydrolase